MVGLGHRKSFPAVRGPARSHHFFISLSHIRSQINTYHSLKLIWRTDRCCLSFLCGVFRILPVRKDRKMETNVCGSLRMKSATKEDLTALNGYRLSMHVPIFWSPSVISLSGCNLESYVVRRLRFPFLQYPSQ